MNDPRLEKLLDHLEDETSIEDALAMVRENWEEMLTKDPEYFALIWSEHKDHLEVA